jgi:hypothetical protein
VKEARSNDGPGLPPGKWEDHFRKAGVRVEDLNGARSGQARATILGNFLSQHQGREVPIQVGDSTGRACLRVTGETRPRRYYFEISWDTPLISDSTATQPAEGPSELDDGLGPTVTNEPDVAPPITPAPPPEAESASQGTGRGQGPAGRGTSGNEEAWA